MNTVRIARPEEFERIAAFYDEMIAAMAESAFDPEWDRETYPDDAFLRRAVEEGCMVVCECDGELAGAGVLEHHGATEYDGADWNIAAAIDEYSVIHLLCSLPRFQGRDIGRTLLRAMIDIARKNGKRCVRLDILPDNAPAQNLYESEGFVRIGEATLHYPDGSFDSVLFELPLN